MKIWYENPAWKWGEALPIGNGTLGGMVYGNPKNEIIQLNEDSVWSGKSLNRLNPDALENLPKIRKLLRDGKVLEAERLSKYALAGVPSSQRAYQTAGELYMNFYNEGKVSEYRRELDLDDGVVSVSYNANDTLYTRKIFSSFVDGVMVIHLEANGEGKLDFDCRFGRKRHFTDEITVDKDRAVEFKLESKDGISFTTRVMSANCDGQVQTIGEHLIIKDATTATLLLCITTSFRADDYEKVNREILDRASKKEYTELLENHLKDFRALSTSMSLKFKSKEDFSRIPTDKRMEQIKNGIVDVDLVATYLQYGRYLLISSSRGNALPANLQGIWNDSMTPPWESKYTININIQMNYWMAESGNLSQCHEPYFNHLRKMMVNGKKTAKEMYGCEGSMCHHNTDIYADTLPQGHLPTCTYWAMGEAWFATHIWERYAYTKDIKFLEDNFDILEENVIFLNDYLILDKNGNLVTSPTASPENRYFDENGQVVCLSEGCTMDNAIIRELFNGYIEACKVLGKTEKIKMASDILDKLPEFKIGKYGQVQEWLDDYEEPDPGHRHISHLYGLYPGNLFNYEDTPELMEASKVTLDRRLSAGGGYTGWSRAWIVGLWARLGEGEKAFYNIHELLATETFDNLMNTHPQAHDFVFQIDGNLGASAGMIEMLVQSRHEKVYLLPAISDEINSGSLSGVCLKGGATLSMEWENGKVTSLEIISKFDRDIIIVIEGNEKTFSLKSHENNKLI